MNTVLTAAWLWDGTKRIPEPIVEIADGRVTRIRTRAEDETPTGAKQLDYPGATLAPSFFDVHIHGAAGHDVMEATPEAVDAISRSLASRGTGSFLTTTVTAPVEATLQSLAGLAKLIARSQASPDSDGAKPLGIHLEGPFLSHAKRGVHPPALLLEPSVTIFDRFFEAAEGHVRLMTIAPELPGAIELAAHAVSRGVRVSVGHSNATAAETRAAIAVGATSATHTFNAMRPLDHREPGILGTVLTTDSLYSELICDGVHVDRSLIKLWWRAKGASRAILVTDGMSAAGMPEGEYMLGGFPVQVANGIAMLNGVLAGSVLTLDKALQNFLEFTGESVETALPLLTRNPAAMTGLELSAGSLREGDAANIVALGSQGQLLASIVGGRIS